MTFSGENLLMANQPLLRIVGLICYSYTEFGEIMQNKGHYAFQGHSRSPILVPIESTLCNFLLVINTKLPPILHRFQVIADYRSNFR